jgi:hypothetical protein
VNGFLLVENWYLADVTPKLVSLVEDKFSQSGHFYDRVQFSSVKYVCHDLTSVKTVNLDSFDLVNKKYKTPI